MTIPEIKEMFSPRHKLSGVFMVAVVALLIGLLSLTTFLRDLDGRSFDYLSTIAPALPEQPGITLVAIDEPSMDAIGQQWPWSRERHAELIAQLRNAGTKAIAFDVLFAEPADKTQDQALVDAMGPDIVLAADESLIERPYGSTLVRTEPMPALITAGARTGIASLSMDGDGVLRNMPVYSDGFMTQLLEITSGISVKTDPIPRRIQHFGPAGSYPTISYYQALDPEAYLPPDYLKDQIVIIGFALQTNADVATGGIDAFETAYTLRSRQLTPGIEVQATIFDNLRTGLSIGQAPRWLSLVLIIIAAAWALLVSRPNAPGKKALLLAISLLGIVGACWLLLQYGRYWIGPVAPSTALILSVAAIATRDFAGEQNRRREVQNAFGQYLAPEMVQKIADDPSLLNLGGVNRELTILFSDIRGFTAISEAMQDDPQGLTRMINAILTPLSNIILRHGGTIDKYMGDCIMAFWNAPLDDPNHALHALEAAREMLAEMDNINREIQEMLPTGANVSRIRMGIGINTGTCVVGNMGSDRRFDYSVLGDAVNLASRLEGQCDELSVDILIGQTTVEAAPSLSFRKVADIKVKGRSTTEATYTFCDDL
ncbi:adenylate/guanylate cyclase domain-containing protein [Parasphingorhabdus litoris]|uniref:Adenylate/guanylate cyclase domain-containing protein n=1 Tax=Parasphingorhabdus litoris TaxID=394733 RepID=A0ABN1AJQ8_9SPHN|nr:CHASE2 domain-containing protein [Parasphingorhabdus litoris]